ncbi:hypothetical protein C8R47DRAFT_1078399 [Mycena vitilis]|nr:hypothetical protein C8R47DRAFT_1078399 [Mycena vitilis]
MDSNKPRGLARNKPWHTALGILSKLLVPVVSAIAFSSEKAEVDVPYGKYASVIVIASRMKLAAPPSSWAARFRSRGAELSLEPEWPLSRLGRSWIRSDWIHYRRRGDHTAPPSSHRSTIRWQESPWQSMTVRREIEIFGIMPSKRGNAMAHVLQQQRLSCRGSEGRRRFWRSVEACALVESRSQSIIHAGCQLFELSIGSKSGGSLQVHVVQK